MAWRAWAIGVLVVGLVLSPLFAPGTDDFPLSSYPMFSHRRGRMLTLDHVVGVRDGARVPIPPRLLGSREVLQAGAIATRAARSGRAAELCATVALAVRGDGGITVDHLEVRRDRFDVLTYFRGSPEPVDGEILAACPVAAEGR